MPLKNEFCALLYWIDHCTAAKIQSYKENFIFPKDLGLLQFENPKRKMGISTSQPTVMFTDNQAEIALADGQGANRREKHIEIH
jgi:hypothetical protein